MAQRNALITITLLFLVSVLCRIPFLTRPLEGEHDWLTIHSLLTISIWDRVGLQRAHYSLRMTYPNDADRFIAYEEKRVVFDQRGNSYFVAFPPFAFLFGYWTLKLFHLPAQGIYLKLINLTVLLAAALLLYSILERACGGNSRTARVLSVLGIALFLFNRAVLLSFGNLYFPITLVIPIWIAAVYFYCAAQDGGKHQHLHSAFFFVLVFVACYCDWLGMAAAGAFFLWSIAHRVRQTIDYFLAGLAALAAGIAGALVTVQYSSINGARSFLRVLVSRFESRAGVIKDSPDPFTLWNPQTYHEVVLRYLEQYTPLLLLLGGLLFVYFIFPRLFRSLHWTKDAQRAAFLLGCPVAADHLLLLNHTAIHNYAVLKAVPFLVLAVVFLMDGLMRHSLEGAPSSDLARPVRFFPLLTRFAVVVVVVCLLATRWYLGERNILFPSYSRLGAIIRQQSNPRQVIFMLRRRPAELVRPDLIYFAGRNIQMVDCEEETRKFLEKYGQQEGVLFVADVDGNLTSAPTIVHRDHR